MRRGGRTRDADPGGAFAATPSRLAGETNSAPNDAMLDGKKSFETKMRYYGRQALEAMAASVDTNNDTNRIRASNIGATAPSWLSTST
jgi:hypothetical protein